jgi:hypothetical protein
MTVHKGRTWTPISIAVLTVFLTAGLGFIGWCGDTAVKELDKNFETIERKQDIMYRSLSLIRDKENSDVLCITKNLYQCCGEKVSGNC